MKPQYIIFVILLSLLAISGCVDDQSEENTTINNTSDPVQNIEYLEQNVTPVFEIGRYEAPDDQVFLIWNIHIKNAGNTLINTNPHNWKVLIDGVEYSAHQATYSDNIAHETVNIYPGADYQTSFVYLINSDDFLNADDVAIGYVGPNR